jgi:hypothetical protein
MYGIENLERISVKDSFFLNSPSTDKDYNDKRN